MNRRDAIAALMSLPATASLSVASVRPSDVLVIECDTHLSRAEKDLIRAEIDKVWPGRKAVVCDGGSRLKIARES